MLLLGGPSGLTEAGLTEAGLTEAGLTEAGLTEAGLTEAGLTEAGLTEAGLTEAGLTEAGLTEAGPGGLTVVRAGHRIFDEASEAARDPALRRYLADLVRPYGVELRDEAFAQGSGQSYGEMAAALLAETIPADEPADLLVCAFAVGDVIPGRSTAAYLSDQCPGAPAGFAVCDQGVAAPYTALRLMATYLRTPGCRRAVLVVTEQSALHYELPAPAPMPAVHAAVTLLFTSEAAGAGPAAHQPVTVSRVGSRPAVAAGAGAAAARAGAAGAGAAGVGAAGAGAAGAGAAGAGGELADRLDRELAALSAGRQDVTLVTGSGLTCMLPSSWHPPATWEVIAASADQPCTGAWSELAGCLDQWQGSGRRVLLADFEPVLGYLCACGVSLAS